MNHFDVAGKTYPSFVEALSAAQLSGGDAHITHIATGDVVWRPEHVIKNRDLKDMIPLIRRAVWRAVVYWPNAHLGDCTPREDIASAFRFIRARLMKGISLRDAITDLEMDVDRYMDM